MSNIPNQQHHCQNNNNNYNNNTSNRNNNSNSSSNSNSGPCGACKYLRRKCVKGCIFAPYFDSEQGTAHFAAVHKVFGASNASKILLRVPVHKRLDAVVTLCYEALSRVRDPVYGCVSNIFSLQQQVLGMQAELAFVQSRISTIQRPPVSCAFPVVDHNVPRVSPYQNTSFPTTPSSIVPVPTSLSFDNALQSQPVCSKFAATNAELASFYNLTDYHQGDMLIDDDDLQALTREFVSKYLPGVKFKSEHC